MKRSSVACASVALAALAALAMTAGGSFAAPPAEKSDSRAKAADPGTPPTSEKQNCPANCTEVVSGNSSFCYCRIEPIKSEMTKLPLRMSYPAGSVCTFGQSSGIIAEYEGRPMCKISIGQIPESKER